MQSKRNISICNSHRILPVKGYALQNEKCVVIFQRMIHKVIADLEGCDYEGYIDDVIVYGNTWEQHLQHVKDFLSCLRKAQLTVNLVKSEFGQAYVTYSGYLVGQEQIKLVEAKVNAFINFPVSNNKSQLIRFLGMVGYYRKFCKNFEVITEP